MASGTYYCHHCDYLTNHKTKYHRHLSTLKHKIATEGISCCGLVYYDKHRWVNHKKSVKHYQNKDLWAKECFTTENPDIDIDIPRPSSAPPFANSPSSSPTHCDQSTPNDYESDDHDSRNTPPAGKEEITKSATT